MTVSTSERCAAGSSAGTSLATARTSPKVKARLAATKRTATNAARRRLRTRRRGRGDPFSLRTRKRADSSPEGPNGPQSLGSDRLGADDRLGRRRIDAARLLDGHENDLAGV